MFQQYPQSDVNEPILLHEGRFRIRQGKRRVEGSGSAWLQWLPSPGIQFDVGTPAGFTPSLRSVSLELPGFRTENTVPVSMTFAPGGRLKAFASEMTSEGDSPLVSVGFQVANFTDFITPGLSATPGEPATVACPSESGDPFTSERSLTIQAAQLEHAGWLVHLVAVRNANDLYKRLKATGGYAFTHVGQLTRTDGAPFPIHDAEVILNSLTARGKSRQIRADRVDLSGCSVVDFTAWRWARGRRLDRRHRCG